MSYRRRVTLRCLCEDLTSGWADHAHLRGYEAIRDAIALGASDGELAERLSGLPTTALVAHPLISSFYAAFEVDDPAIKRESISGLANPHWWKQKASRWRGAATDASAVGSDEVWLCAGGIRADGDGRDFYASFMRVVQSQGPSSRLPAEEDRRLQVVEEKAARYESWLQQVRLSTLICLNECATSSGPRLLHVPHPAPKQPADPLAHMTFQLERVDESDGALIELMLTFEIADRSAPNLAAAALSAARAVVEPVADAWRPLPGPADTEIWSALVASETLEVAAEATASGVLRVEQQQSTLRLGVQAHYTAKDHIVGATVAGDAVRGLCGIWFVPTADPEAVPMCPACKIAHDGMPEG